MVSQALLLADVEHGRGSKHRTTESRDGEIREKHRTEAARSEVALSSAAAELEDQVRAALQQSPIHSHRRVNVVLEGERVYLHGRLESFYYKQLAQELVRSICRNVQVMNEIDVD